MPTALTPFLGPEPAPTLDARVRAALARASASVSPASALLARLDWSAHVAVSPGKRMELGRLALHQSEQLSDYVRECLLAGRGEVRARIEPPAGDRRFVAPEWRQWPFALWHQSFLLTQQWWEAPTHGVAGIEKHHEDVVAFAARQWLDMFSPGDQLATNPVALRRTAEQGGANLVRGMLNLIDDLERSASGAAAAGTENFVTDHVAPWRSVHELHYLTAAEITYVLTSGGHNAGIVSPPGDPRRRYQIPRRAAGDSYMAPDDWLAAAPEVQGSWWPAWQQWPAAHSSASVKPPRIGASAHRPVGDAPGSYVLEK